MTDTSKEKTTEQKIEDAAVELFSNKGFHETSMRDLAAEAGVAIGTIYHHYEDKNQIMLKMIRRALEEREKTIQELNESNLPVKWQLEKVLRMHLERVQKNETRGKLVLNQLRQPNKAFQQEFNRLYDELANYLTNLFQRGIETGEVTSCNPRVAAYALLGAVETVTLKAVAGKLELTEEFLDNGPRQLTNLLWHGIESSN
ncbi:TetR/AcrR family transcriptional regulator [Candidatus Bipolaricaulota bacterium]|nr:TetR/AcrR family transcriptional regulator [Candidatus Bipolaricaulota bacterium]